MIPGTNKIKHKKTQRRVMQSGDGYAIEEKNSVGDWEVVARVPTISAAKSLLKNLKTLEAEADNE